MHQKEIDVQPGRGGNGRLRRWWAAAAAGIGLALLVWVLARIDYERMRTVLQEADATFLMFVPLAIGLELLARGWKWRQLLFDIRPIGTWRLFGAIMAGYFANLLIPVGLSPFVRAWLIARLESLKMAMVLATVAIDRFIDGVVFVASSSSPWFSSLFPSRQATSEPGSRSAGW